MLDVIGVDHISVGDRILSVGVLKLDDLVIWAVDELAVLNRSI